MRSKTVTREEVVSLYKIASAGMTKKALELNDDAKAALVGALGGAGVGLVSHLVTPKDKDENQTSRLLSHVLAGAAMGGLSGYGLKRLHSRVADATKTEDPGWYQRNAPELSYSGAATLGGLGAGAYAGVKGLDAIKGKYGLERLKTLSPSAGRGIDLLRSSNPSDIAGNASLRAIQDALGEANKSISDRLLSKLPSRLPVWLGGDKVRAAIKRQAPKDMKLLNALRAAGGAGRRVNRDAARIVGSRFVNPRKVINALQRGGGKKKLIAALLSAGLLTTGAVIRSQNRE